VPVSFVVPFNPSPQCAIADAQFHSMPFIFGRAGTLRGAPAASNLPPVRGALATLPKAGISLGSDQKLGLRYALRSKMNEIGSTMRPRASREGRGAGFQASSLLNRG